MKKKKGFTLVELLAVIAILGLILILAIPKVMETLDRQKKRTLELTARSIIKSAEERYIENSAYGITEEITCEGISNITSSDFESCNIEFDDKGNASVTIIGKGKYDGLSVCNGTKTEATAANGKCTLACAADEVLIEKANVTTPYEVENKTACSTYVVNLAKEQGIPDSELSMYGELCNGGTIDSMTFNDLVLVLIQQDVVTEEELVKNNVIKGTIEKTCEKGINCTYDGELVKGAEFIHEQYTYRYKEVKVDDQIMNLEENGWSVSLTDKESTDPVNSKICSYVNGKPIVSTVGMFLSSQASSIDLRGSDIKNVTNMSVMFYGCNATSINLTGLDARKVKDMSHMFGSAYNLQTIDLTNFSTRDVTNMSAMFYGINIDSLDLSSFDTGKVTDVGHMFEEAGISNIKFGNFDTSNVTDMQWMFYMFSTTSLDLSSFNTSKVTNMSYMFCQCQATTLDLSSFDTSNVTNMSYMFASSKATIGYARTQAEADKFNAISGKPEGLTFTVKPSS